MLLSPAILLPLIWGGLAQEQLAADAVVEPTWIQFYGGNFPEDRLSYFYDPASVSRRGGVLLARWKVLGSRDETTTLYAIEIDCGAGTFTETGTVLINADGEAQDLPESELLSDQVIVPDTSSDVFRRTFCR